MSYFSNCKINYTVATIVFGIIALLSFGISVVVIYSNGIKFESSLHPYPDFASIGTYTATVDVINTQWTYDLDVKGFSGKIQQKCPTVNHDADLYINGKLVGRTDRKTLDINQLNYILDGTGNKLYQVKTGNFAETLINGNKIFISMGIYDLNEKLIGYYSGQNFVFQNNIIIQDSNGNNVVKMTRELDPVWKWTITLLNNTAPFNDFRLSALLAGYSSFSEDSKKTDLCNNYFWATSWTLVALVGCCLVALGYFIWNKCRESKQVFDTSINDIKLNRIV